MTKVLRKRVNFGKVPHFLEIPNLIEIQRNSYDMFLQRDQSPDKREEAGLQSAFLSVFPIVDYNETSSIEFSGYNVGTPKFDVRDCLQKGLTYAAPLKIKVKLNLWEVETKRKNALRKAEKKLYK